jgi:hypothetical protein
MASRLQLYAFAVASAALLSGASFADDDIDPSLIQQGFDISPVPKSKLSLIDNVPAKVGLGSYLVNAAGDCSGCHSLPRYLPNGDKAGSNPNAGDPFVPPPTQSVTGQLLANYNVSHYLAGGMCFGPYMARNLTPDANGLPEGLIETEFVKALRTGEDISCEKNPKNPICTNRPPPPNPLQVMPWPTYHSFTDSHLSAIYAYLRALPSATACNTVADGCPGFWGAAQSSSNYVYPNTPDCPNPAPP